MQRTSKHIGAALAVAAAFAAPAFAELPASEIAKLGTTLTPVGAEKAGNAAGTIPAWDGGLTKPLPGYRPGQAYPNPFPDDKPKFTLTGANADQYKANLSEGQLALLKKSLDSQQQEAANLLKLIDGKGQNLDIRA